MLLAPQDNMSRPFRAQLVLMMMGIYSYGNFIDDPNAFVLRVESWFRNRNPEYMVEDEGSI